MPTRKRLLMYSLSAVVLLAVMTGCHSSAPTASTPPAAGQADAAQQVQANPNIPPEAKARIVQQMQGRAAPPPGPAAPSKP